MSTLRIFVAAEQGLVRARVKSLLESRQGWEVNGEAANGRDAVEKVKRLKPDIVVLDISMPELNGLEVTREILTALPKTEIAVFISRGTEDLVDDLLTAGVRGFVLKSEADHDLLQAVETLSQHKPFLTLSVTEMVLQGYLAARNRQGHGSGLTRRQREIVRLLAQGHTNNEVAAALGISPKTVEAHRAKVMHRLKLHSFSDLIRFAIRTRMVEV